jgi:hypothetical protein
MLLTHGLRAASGNTGAASLTLTAATGVNNTSSSSSHTINLPTGRSVGDLILTSFCFDDDGNNVSSFTGFTQLFNNPFDLSDQGRHFVYYRVVTGSEGATASLTSGNGTRFVAWTGLIKGWNSSFVPQFAFTDYQGTNPDPPSLTPTWGSQSCLWLAIAAGRATNGAGVSVSAYPTDYSYYQNSQALSERMSMGVAARQLTASSQNPGTFTMSGSSNFSVATIAIRA